MQGINKIIIASYRVKDTDVDCSAAISGSYCQVFNLQTVPFVAINQTVKNCMEKVHLYIFPNNGTDA